MAADGFLHLLTRQESEAVTAEQHSRESIRIARTTRSLAFVSQKLP